MKVGFYSPYLDTFGGGERYILTLASYLSKREDVDIFWDDVSIKASLSKFLKIDLSKTHFAQNIFKTQKFNRVLATRKYDLIFVLSDGSIPITFARKNILHFQVPFVFNNISKMTRLKLKRYQSITANSHFTKKFIDKTYDTNSQVIYPPVDIKALIPEKKEKIILSVGRFGQNQLHPKKQEILIEVFKELYKNQHEWKLYLIGQAKKEDQKYLRHLKKISSGLGIRILENESREKLQDIYSRASIYWHATGFGEDELKSPQKMEHFGIATVEASAAGVVPIVVGHGGQKEIVSHNKNGLLWWTKTQLLEETMSLIENKQKMRKLSQSAIQNSKRFSKERFIKSYEEIIYK